MPSVEGERVKGVFRVVASLFTATNNEGERGRESYIFLQRVEVKPITSPLKKANWHYGLERKEKNIYNPLCSSCLLTTHR